MHKILTMNRSIIQLFVFICLRCVLCFCVYWSSFCLMFLCLFVFVVSYVFVFVCLLCVLCFCVCLSSLCLMFLCLFVFVVSYVFVFIDLRFVLCFCVYLSSLCLMFLCLLIFVLAYVFVFICPKLESTNEIAFTVYSLLIVKIKQSVKTLFMLVVYNNECSFMCMFCRSLFVYFVLFL
jgi:hypothetical protein